MKEGKKSFTEWTRKDFESLPRPTSFTNTEIGEVDSLVIIPTKHKHDSGFRCMEFVTIQNGEPTYIVSGCSDVIEIGGIGGYNVCKQHYDGNKVSQRLKSKLAPFASWKINCLPTSGLLRIFCDKKMYIGASLSSFEIFFKED